LGFEKGAHRSSRFSRNSHEEKPPRAADRGRQKNGTAKESERAGVSRGILKETTAREKAMFERRRLFRARANGCFGERDLRKM